MVAFQGPFSRRISMSLSSLAQSQCDVLVFGSNGDAQNDCAVQIMSVITAVDVAKVFSSAGGNEGVENVEVESRREADRYTSTLISP